MHHLAIECSGFRGSVAAFAEDQCLVECVLPTEVSSVQALAPSIVRTLRDSGVPKVDYLGVTIGPGSFTSLRVGLATAQALGFAWHVPIVPICSMQVTAFRGVEQLKLAPDGGGVLVVAVMNAFRRQVFTAAWRCWAVATQEFGMRQVAMPQVIDAEAWVHDPVGSLQWSSPEEAGQGRGDTVLITGPGLENYRPESAGQWKSWSDRTDGAALLAPADVWCPTAADVGQLEWQAYRRGEFLEPRLLRANYVRASAAEEKVRGGQGV